MPPDRELVPATPGATPTHEDTQQLIEAERGHGTQGILRRWQASNSAWVVLTSDANGVRISRDAGATPPAQVIVDGTTAGGNLAGTYPNPTLSAAIMDALVPPGTVIAWAGPGAGYPAGWLPCDGSAVDGRIYGKLFAAIGPTYNIGGEAPFFFRLPNLTGRVILGASGSHALGTFGGAETVAGPTHTHPGSHSHGLNSHVHGQNGHTHPMGNMQTHVHGVGDHTHVIGVHTHTSTAHRHDLDHNHPLAAGVAVASGAITGVHEGPSAVVNVSANGHAHDVDIPPLGATNSGETTPAATGAPSANPTSTMSVSVNTGQPTVSVPDTGTPSNPNTEGATGATATDATAHAASYAGATVPTMMPFLSLGFIIRTG